jgi:primosomal protein N' (replication factor Y)
MGPALEYLAQARALGADLNGNGPVLLYDPVPMRMARRANLERAQLLAESTSRPALQAFLAEWRPLLEGIKAPSRLRWHLEVDPLEF